MTKISDILGPRADLGVKKVDDDLLILDKRNEKIHQLNATASVVWEGLSEGLTEEMIAKNIAKNFDITSDLAAQDVQKIVKQFIDLTLLQTNRSE